MKKTDLYIDKLKNEPKIDEDGIKLKTGINKTFINTNQSDAEPISNEQARFMQVMEQDAKERQERRRENKRKAEILKQKGNVEFAQKNYQKAIEYYTEVLIFFFALS
jgi:tetratricopeptide (TPR) repeat protein